MSDFKFLVYVHMYLQLSQVCQINQCTCIHCWTYFLFPYSMRSLFQLQLRSYKLIQQLSITRYFRPTNRQLYCSFILPIRLFFIVSQLWLGVFVYVRSCVSLQSSTHLKLCRTCTSTAFTNKDMHVCIISGTNPNQMLYRTVFYVNGYICIRSHTYMGYEGVFSTVIYRPIYVA